MMKFAAKSGGIRTKTTFHDASFSSHCQSFLHPALCCSPYTVVVEIAPRQFFG